MERNRLHKIAEIIPEMTWRELNAFAKCMKEATEFRYGTEPHAALLDWAEKIVGADQPSDTEADR